MIYIYIHILRSRSILAEVLGLGLIDISKSKDHEHRLSAVVSAEQEGREAAKSGLEHLKEESLGVNPWESQNAELKDRPGIQMGSSCREEIRTRQVL